MYMIEFTTRENKGPRAFLEARKLKALHETSFQIVQERIAEVGTLEKRDFVLRELALDDNLFS